MNEEFKPDFGANPLEEFNLNDTTNPNPLEEKKAKYTLIKINNKDYKVLTSYLEECEAEGKTCALLKGDTVEFITDEEFKKRKKANVMRANQQSKNYFKNQRYR